MIFPGDPGVPSTGKPSDYTRFFDPRVGIAWQPKALPNTSIRAAFGMYATPIEYLVEPRSDIHRSAPIYFLNTNDYDRQYELFRSFPSTPPGRYIHGRAAQSVPSVLRSRHLRGRAQPLPSGIHPVRFRPELYRWADLHLESEPRTLVRCELAGQGRICSQRVGSPALPEGCKPGTAGMWSG